MNARYSSLLICLLVLVLSNSTYPAAHSVERGSTTEPSRNNQFFRTAEESGPQLNPKNLQDPKSAALEGLKIMVSQLVKTDDALDEKHARELGLEPKDLLALTNNMGDDRLFSNVFRIFRVSLRDLCAFAPSQTARSLLADTHQLLFSVKINNAEKFSITVRSVLSEQVRVGNQTELAHERNWRPTKWGLPNLTQRLSAELKRVRENSPNSKDFSLVSIPSLNRNFLSYEDGTDIKLVPLVSDRLFVEGKPLSVREVLLSLIPEANSVDDSPR